MFDKLGDISKMIEGMAQNNEKFQAELESRVFNVKSAGGIIEVVMNGKGEVIDININDSLLSDKMSLQILLIGVLNDAFKMVELNRQSSAMGIFGDLSKFGVK